MSKHLNSSLKPLTFFFKQATTSPTSSNSIINFQVPLLPTIIIHEPLLVEPINYTINKICKNKICKSSMENPTRSWQNSATKSESFHIKTLSEFILSIQRRILFIFVTGLLNDWREKLFSVQKFCPEFSQFVRLFLFARQTAKVLHFFCHFLCFQIFFVDFPDIFVFPTKFILWCTFFTFFQS